MGIAFPFKSMSLIGMSLILLFLLMFLNTLAIKQEELFKSSGWKAAFVTLILMFGLFPLMQTAAALLLIRDHDFVFGFVVSALAPAALVNPFFARHRGGDAPLALLIVMLSTVLCPFLTVPVLNALGMSAVFLNSKYLIAVLTALTLLPVAASLLTNRLWPASARRSAPLLPYANSLILASLMFILVGSSLNQIPFRLLFNSDFFRLLGLYLVFEFGTFFVVRHAARQFTLPARAESVALSVSTRNLAISASLMLFFHPKAALPPAIGLAVHALFFQWLVWKKHDRNTV